MHIRSIIRQVMQSQIGAYPVETLKDNFIQSDTLNRFLVIRTGWQRDTDRYALIQDVELREDGSIIIYADNTDQSLAEDFMEAGVPADKIIKAYDPDQQERLKQVIESAPEYRQAA